MGTIRTLFILIGCMYANAAYLKTCLNDKDCAGKTFCYAKTGLCSPCMQCQAYLRHDKDGSSCAKEPWQCGDCLEGYELEELSDGQLRGLCIPTIKSTSAALDPQPLLKVAESQNYIFVGAIILFVAIAAAGTLYFRRRASPVQVNVRTRVGHPCDDSISTPPSNHAPSAPPPPYEDVAEYKDGEEETFSGYVCEREEEKCQMASKFRDPNYVRTPNNNPVNNNPPHEDVVDGPPAPEEAFLIDENTLPSNWSPGPEYEEPPPPGAEGPSTTPLATSFEGILRLNNTTGMGGQTPPPRQPTNHTADDSSNTQSAPQFNVTNITVINSATGPTGIFNITNI